MSDAFQPLDLDALFALKLPDLDYAIDELCPLGSLGLMSAREKAGKGLLALDMLASIAAEEPYLGRAVRGGPAIYCAAEENIRDVRQRIEARIGSRRDLPLYLLPLDGSTEDRLRLDDLVSIQRLIGMVDTLKPIAVVLDVLREFHDGKEDSADEMAPLMRPLRQIAHTYNVALLVTHHHGKGGTFRGSTAIRAACDYEIAFTRTDDTDDLRGRLRVEGRYGPRQSLDIKLGDGLRWELTTPPLTLIDPSLRERILATLQDCDDWLTSNDLAALLADVKLKTIQNELARMVKENPLPFATQQGRSRRYHALAPRLLDDDEADEDNASGHRSRFPAPLKGNREGKELLSSRPNNSGNGGNNHRELPDGSGEGDL